jgi:hypothetical protein
MSYVIAFITNRFTDYTGYTVPLRILPGMIESKIPSMCDKAISTFYPACAIETFSLFSSISLTTPETYSGIIKILSWSFMSPPSIFPLTMCPVIEPCGRTYESAIETRSGSPVSQERGSSWSTFWMRYGPVYQERRGSCAGPMRFSP